MFLPPRLYFSPFIPVTPLVSLLLFQGVLSFKSLIIFIEEIFRYEHPQNDQGIIPPFIASVHRPAAVSVFIFEFRSSS